MVKVRIAAPVLQENSAAAAENRSLFQELGLFVVNLMSSPGSGKTSILERTLSHLPADLKVGVIEGDIYTTKDAERVAAHGVPVVQINTAGACHLDARMVKAALEDLPLKELDLLLVENVGNLICPAEFDLGEDARVVVLSVTEGADKPLKYPLVFRLAAVALVNKTDLLPYTDCDLDALCWDLRVVNPELTIFPVSARLDTGFAPWVKWLRERVRIKKGRGGGSHEQESAGI